VKKVENIDGYKFYFNENQWLMIRLSGTEPLLRLYAEAENVETVRSILDTASEMIRNL
jgi:phosphomannomutase